jgi:hypothetical protein
MIDFTKIQTTPVPPSITSLQNVNGTLTKDNQNLKKAIYVGTGLLIVAIIIYFYQQKQEDEANKKNHFTRD